MISDILVVQKTFFIRLNEHLKYKNNSNAALVFFSNNPIGYLCGYRRKGARMVSRSLILDAFLPDLVIFSPKVNSVNGSHKAIFGYFGITRTRSSGYPNFRVLLFFKQISDFSFENPNFQKPEKPDPNFSGNPNAHP